MPLPSTLRTEILIHPCHRSLVSDLLKHPLRILNILGETRRVEVKWKMAEKAGVFREFYSHHFKAQPRLKTKSAPQNKWYHFPSINSDQVS